MSIEVKQSNPNAFKILLANLSTLDGLVGKTGWFATAKYEDGTPVAYIAAINEFGVTINHPGGTPYRFDENGMTVFVRKDSPGASSLPVTKPHTIVIPARPFFRPTIAREINNWRDMFLAGSRAILAGNATGHQVLEAVALRAAGDVAKTIASITTPPLKPSTIAARRREMADTKTTGALTKPLVHTSLMVGSVTGVVEEQ